MSLFLAKLLILAAGVDNVCGESSQVTGVQRRFSGG